MGAQQPRSQARTRTHAELFLNSFSSAAFSKRLCLHSTMRRCASGHHVCIPHSECKRQRAVVKGISPPEALPFIPEGLSPSGPSARISGPQRCFLATPAARAERRWSLYACRVEAGRSGGLGTGPPSACGRALGRSGRRTQIPVFRGARLGPLLQSLKAEALHFM